MLDVDLFQLYGEVQLQHILLPIKDYFQFHSLLCIPLHSLHYLNLLQCKPLIV